MSEKSIKKAIFSLYSIGWKIAIPLLRLNPRLAEGFDERMLRYAIPQADIWIQAASAGEAYLAELLLKELSSVFPGRIMVTSNTAQGIEILERAVRDIHPNNSGNIFTAYFPFDKPELMEKAVRAMNPRLMVLLESEIWFGLLLALKKNHSQIIVINGRMSDKSLKRYQLLLASSFWYSLRPDKVLAISQADADRFATLFGMKNTKIMPNMKFDRCMIPPDSISDRDEKTEKPFLVFGSIGEPEESDVENILIDIYQKIPDIIIGLFPRHMHRIGHWKKRLNEMAVPWQLRSEITKKRHDSGDSAFPNLQNASSGIILWDRFGELHVAYDLASAAFVGGSLAPLGGQNFLEALTCGIIPVIGPHWETFEWVGQEIIAEGLLRVASDWKAVANILREQIKYPKPCESVCNKAFRYIENRKGGTNQACSLIREFFNSKDPKGFENP